MSRPSRIRLIGPFIAAALSLAWGAQASGAASALGGAAAIFVVVTGVSEAVWRRRASAEELRADLEDRTRNPPA